MSNPLRKHDIPDQVIIINDIDMEGHMIGKMRLDIIDIELHHKLTIGQLRGGGESVVTVLKQLCPF
jgi:hypothetical protein